MHGPKDRAIAITGAHVVLYTPKQEELRAVLRDVFGWRFVDDGDGVTMVLPGGVEALLYQPRHRTAI